MNHSPKQAILSPRAHVDNIRDLCYKTTNKAEKCFPRVEIIPLVNCLPQEQEEQSWMASIHIEKKKNSLGQESWYTSLTPLLQRKRQMVYIASPMTGGATK